MPAGQRGTGTPVCNPLTNPLLSVCRQWIGQAWLDVRIQCQSLHQQAPLCWHLYLILHRCLLWTKWLLITTATQDPSRESKITKLVREKGILKEIWEERDQHWWIICIIWIIWWIMHHAVVFYSISTSIRCDIQRIWVTGGELWNFNKLGYLHSWLQFCWLPSYSGVSHQSYFLRYFFWAESPFSFHPIRLSQFQHHYDTGMWNGLG